GRGRRFDRLHRAGRAASRAPPRRLRSDPRLPAGGADGCGAVAGGGCRSTTHPDQSERDRDRAQARRGHRADRRAVLSRHDLPRAPPAVGIAIMSAARTSASKISAENVVVRLGGNLVVDGVTLDLKAGELAVLIGPNGAGKTTLVRALAGLIPAEGRISIEGRSLASLTPSERARRIAYLPQGHAFHWPMAVTAVVALGRYPHGDVFSGLTDA